MLRCRFFLYIVSEIYIFFWFYQSVRFEGNILKIRKKKELRQPRNALTLQVLLSLLTKQVISCLVCMSIWPEVSIINLFANVRVFLVGLGNSNEFLGIFVEVRLEEN